MFTPDYAGSRLVAERLIDFDWYPGFAEVQKKKNVFSLHAAAKRAGLERILEISTKSDEKIGQRLSAFSLKFRVGRSEFPLESVYQGAKVFEDCGPFPEIFDHNPREAKRFIRELACGNLIGFELEGERYPLFPKNAFYDWLYIKSLVEHADWIERYVSYDGFTDIEFNPEKQINCQARAFAEFKSLAKKNEMKTAARDFRHFSSMLSPI